MKKKNKKYFLMLVLSTILVSICIPVMGDTDIDTLEYLETKIVTIPGNLNLSFNNSDTGDEDVMILWSVYSSQSNMTVVSFISLTVEVDTSFNNNTKAYTFKDNNSGGFYTVYVNYSSIDVPKSIEKILNETIAAKLADIVDLNDEIKKLNEEIVAINKTRVNLEKQLENMKKTADDWESKYIHEVETNNPLRNTIHNLTKEIESMENDSFWMNYNISVLQQEKESLEASIVDLRDPWATGYSYHGEEYFSFGSWWAFIIGLVLACITAYALFIRLGGKREKKKIKENAIVDIEKPRSHSFLRGLFAMDYGSNKRTEISEGKPLSFAGNSLEPEKLHETPEVTVEKEGYKAIGDLKEPITVMKKPEINWKLVEDEENFKSWSYNGGKPIQAKKNNGVWEIYVDGIKQKDTFGTPLDVYNNIRKYQRDYQFDEISTKIDKVI